MNWLGNHTRLLTQLQFYIHSVKVLHPRPSEGSLVFEGSYCAGILDRNTHLQNNHFQIISTLSRTRQPSWIYYIAILLGNTLPIDHLLILINSKLKV